MPVVVTFSAPKTPPPPPPPPPQVIDADNAEQLLARADFEQANQVAEKVVQKRGLSHSDLARAYRVLGITHAALDKEGQAKEAFIMLLTYEPDATLDASLGPKVLDPFGEARAYWKGLPQRPGVDVTATVHTIDGGVLKITSRDPTHVVKRIVVGYRWSTSGEFTTTTLTSIEGTVEVAAPPPGKTRLDYYANALDEHESVAFEAGTPRIPKSAFAEVGSSTDTKAGTGGFVGSLPFWLTLGAVAVAGGAVGGYFLLRPPTSASLTTSLQCGGAKCN